MGFSIKVAVAAVMLFAPLLPAACGEDEPDPVVVRAGVDKGTVTIGDPIEYTVTVRHDPQYPLLSSIEAPSEDIFKIKKIDDIRRQEGSLLIEGKKFTLTAYRLGDFVLDPVKIDYRDEKGNTQTLSTSPIYIKIASVAEGTEKKDIRDVKTVVSIPRSNFLIYLGVLAAVTALVYWLLRLWFLSRKKTAAIIPEPKLDPEQEALGRLDALIESDLLRKGHTKLYFLQFTDILKRYFERRLNISAPEATTEEILAQLKSKELPSEIRLKIKEVLEAADLAKFAKWKPAPAEILSINQQAKRLIEECRPKTVGPSEGGNSHEL